jgi:hypothetical protein
LSRVSFVRSKDRTSTRYQVDVPWYHGCILGAVSTTLCDAPRGRGGRVSTSIAQSALTFIISAPASWCTETEIDNRGVAESRVDLVQAIILGLGAMRAPVIQIPQG